MAPATRPVLLLLLFVNYLLSASAGAQIELVPKALSNRKTGDSFIIQCKLTGPIQGVVAHPKWFHTTSKVGADEPIGPSGRVRTKEIDQTHTNLLFSKAERVDDGTYKCIAQVDDETLVKSVELSLYEGIQFIDTPTVQHPNDGEDAQIVCRVRADPKPSIFWFRNDDLIKDGDERGYELRNDSSVLFVPHFSVSNDNGIYRCQAIQHDTGDFQSLDITIEGYVKPSINEISPAIEVNENEDATIVCRSSGNPTPKISWTKNGLAIVEDSKYLIQPNGDLVITTVNADDSATYVCKATNLLSSVEQAAQLSVFLKPKTEHIQDMDARQGDNVEVTCRFQGGSPIRVFWRFGSETLEPPAPDAMADTTDERRTVTRYDNEVALRISFLVFQDTGTYECVAENRAGTDVTSFNLRVTYSPIITDKSTEAVRAVSGQQVTMFCQADAIPTPVWSWMTPSGREISTDNTKYFVESSEDNLNTTLKVIVSEMDDYGKYTCKADNGIGNAAVRLIDVFEVQIPPRPELIFESQHPNFAALLIPNYVGLPLGSQPLSVIFEVAKESDFMSDEFTWEEGDVVQTTRDYEASGSYTIPSLQPSTKYVFRVHSTNDAGSSKYAEAPYETVQPRIPEAPTFKPLAEGNQCSPIRCFIEWDEPNDGGSELQGYDVEYQSIGNVLDGELVSVDESKWISIGPVSAKEQYVVLQYLQPTNAYMLRVRAKNDQGDSNWGQTFFETTAETWSSSSSIGAGGIVAIVFFVLLIIFVIVDVSCYYINHCGVLMWICVNCCGKVAPQMKGKEMALEEGQMTTDEKKPLKDSLLDTNERSETNDETAKIIAGPKEGVEKKNTVV